MISHVEDSFKVQAGTYRQMDMISCGTFGMAVTALVVRGGLGAYRVISSAPEETLPTPPNPNPAIAATAAMSAEDVGFTVEGVQTMLDRVRDHFWYLLHGDEHSDLAREKDVDRVLTYTFAILAIPVASFACGPLRQWMYRNCQLLSEGLQFENVHDRMETVNNAWKDTIEATLAEIRAVPHPDAESVELHDALCVLQKAVDEVIDNRKQDSAKWRKVALRGATAVNSSNVVRAAAVGAAYAATNQAQRDAAIAWGQDTAGKIASSELYKKGKENAGSAMRRVADHAQKTSAYQRATRAASETAETVAYKQIERRSRAVYGRVKQVEWGALVPDNALERINSAWRTTRMVPKTLIAWTPKFATSWASKIGDEAARMGARAVRPRGVDVHSPSALVVLAHKHARASRDKTQKRAIRNNAIRALVSLADEDRGNAVEQLADYAPSAPKAVYQMGGFEILLDRATRSNASEELRKNTLDAVEQYGSLKKNGDANWRRLDYIETYAALQKIADTTGVGEHRGRARGLMERIASTRSEVGGASSDAGADAGKCHLLQELANAVPNIARSISPAWANKLDRMNPVTRTTISIAFALGAVYLVALETTQIIAQQRQYSEANAKKPRARGVVGLGTGAVKTGWRTLRRFVGFVDGLSNILAYMVVDAKTAFKRSPRGFVAANKEDANAVNARVLRFNDIAWLADHLPAELNRSNKWIAKDVSAITQWIGRVQQRKHPRWYDMRSVRNRPLIKFVEAAKPDSDNGQSIECPTNVLNALTNRLCVCLSWPQARPDDRFWRDVFDATEWNPPNRYYTLKNMCDIILKVDPRLFVKLGEGNLPLTSFEIARQLRLGDNHITFCYNNDNSKMLRKLTVTALDLLALPHEHVGLGMLRRLYSAYPDDKKERGVSKCDTVNSSANFGLVFNAVKDLYADNTC